MSKIKAHDVTLELGNAIAGLKECQITLTTVTNDARVKGSKRLRTFERVDYTATATVEVGHEGSGLGAPLTRRDLEDAVTSGTARNFTFTIGTGGSGGVFTGKVLVTGMTENAPVEGRMTYSLNLKGVEPITFE